MRQGPGGQAGGARVVGRAAVAADDTPQAAAGLPAAAPGGPHAAVPAGRPAPAPTGLTTSPVPVAASAGYLGHPTDPAPTVQAAPAVEVVPAAVAALAVPGLVVVTGGPGAGRTTLLRRIAVAFPGPVYRGGGLAMLSGVPALPLARAVRARLPAEDPTLLAEAVRSRVRGGLLILDDLQWADPATVAALPLLAAHCRVAVALRTPHRLPAEAGAALRATAAGWYPIAPLSPDEATALAQRVAPRLDPGELAEVVRRAGGLPLAVESLARHAASRGLATPAARPAASRGRATAPTAGPAPEQALTHAVAAALADLTRPARTAMAALGLLGRPATLALLGAGVDELTDAGLVHLVGGDVLPVSPYVAEVAAGLLDAATRTALHRRLAGLVPPGEAARHLAAAGDPQGAYRAALTAASAARTGGQRAELLLLACALPGATPDPRVRLDAAAAALRAGRPRAALRVLGDPHPTGPRPPAADPVAAVLRGEALLQAGDPAAAARAVAGLPATLGDANLRAARDRVVLLARLATDPAGAAALAADLAARYPDPPPHPGLRGALAAARAARRHPGWEYDLASTAEVAGAAGDASTARWCAWLLVQTLASDARLAEAAHSAEAAAQACAADLAYSWQVRFLAAALWCAALRGTALDEVVRRSGDLADHTLPADARGYAVAAASLAEADGGLLASARARLATTAALPTSTAAARDWVVREAAWLDGQPERATAVADAPVPAAGLVDGLRRITTRWAAYDGAPAPADEPPAGPTPPPVRRTLDAWAAAGDPDRFAGAATAWHDVALREEVRCLLAYGLHETDPAQAVPPLLAAERLAAQAGLVVLHGRTQRALRRHGIRRDVRGPRAGGDLTDREREVLRLVAAGEPTRRIAGQLGISGETVETHIRSSMRKLGARTRTEAASVALGALG
ncbi:MAG TPA: LuxR C-terminal-related transcriptional regulator [Micromonosporaceae bacterium]|nr:LuxR C-terminal-related transcriptional regulator [Micromonosporaceae bacterium]